MIFALLSIRSYPFNENFNGIFANAYKDNIVEIEASGSRYCYSKTGKDIMTKPQNAIDPKEKEEWCSNYNKSKTDRPWLLMNFKENVKIEGSSLKAGCCEGRYGCCCRIYSWSLEGSNDNKTWSSLHKIEKNQDFYECKKISYKINSNDNYRLIRLIQDEPEPHCWYCIDLAKIELYGTLNDQSSPSNIGEEEEVSVIGKLSRPSIE